jgi:hypothetical protein
VKSSRTQLLASFLMLGCAAAQTIFGSPIGASALTLGIHSNLHAHSVALQADGNHIDIVVSHPERDAHGPGQPARDHERPPGVSEGDHVVHVTVADVTNPASRRAVLDRTPALAISDALPVVVVPVVAPSHSFALRSRSVDHLRTIVLRL